MFNNCLNRIVMGLNINPAYIGKIFLVSVFFAFKNECYFLFLNFISTFFKSPKNTQFKRHIETWKIGYFIGLGSGNIMNAIFA